MHNLFKDTPHTLTPPKKEQTHKNLSGPSVSQQSCGLFAQGFCRNIGRQLTIMY